jgi:hypothetical protein
MMDDHTLADLIARWQADAKKEGEVLLMAARQEFAAFYRRATDEDAEHLDALALVRPAWLATF